MTTSQTATRPWKLVFYALEDDRVIEPSDPRFRVDGEVLGDAFLADTGPIGTILDTEQFAEEMESVMEKLGADIDAIDDLLAIRRWWEAHDRGWTVYQLEREMPDGTPDRRFQVRADTCLAFYRLRQADEVPGQGQECFRLTQTFGGFDADYAPWARIVSREGLLASLPGIHEAFGIEPGSIGYDEHQRLQAWLQGTLEPWIGLQEEESA